MIDRINKKLSLKNKIIINLIILVLFILSIIFFIIMPSIDEILKIENDIEKQRINLEKKYIKGQNLKNVAKKLDKIKPKIIELDKAFINKNRGLEFITSLEEIAFINNVKQKINLLNSEKKENGIYEEMPLQLFVIGSFENLRDYLLDIEAMPYYININSIKISSEKKSRRDINFQDLQNIDEKEVNNNISMFITAFTYWKK